MARTVTVTTKGIDTLLDDIVRQGRDIDAAASAGVLAAAQVLAEGLRRRTPRSAENHQHLQDYARVIKAGRDGNTHWATTGWDVDAMDNKDNRARQANAIEYGTTKRMAQMPLRRTIAEDMNKARRAMIEAIKTNGVPVE